MSTAAVLDRQAREESLLAAAGHALDAGRALVAAANAGKLEETGLVMCLLIMAVKCVADADREDTGLSFDLAQVIAIACGEAQPSIGRRP